MPHARGRLLRSALAPVSGLFSNGSGPTSHNSGPASGFDGGRSASGPPAPPPHRYAIHLSPTPARCRAGGVVRVLITFRADRRLYATPATMSIGGLPPGVTASFSPPEPLLGGWTLLTIAAAASCRPVSRTLVVCARTGPGDRLATSRKLGLTIR
jgi:hypothetical protein